VLNPANGVPYAWHLDSVTDSFGNEIRFSYTQPTGTNRAFLASITYTYRSGNPVGALRSIDFITEDRPDKAVNALPGFKISTDRRLSRIEIKMGGALIRRYNLTYSQSVDSGRSLLSSVQEFGSDGVTALPTSTFMYSHNAGQGGSIGWSSQAASGWNLPGTLAFVDTTKKDTGVRLVDVNADGLIDVVRSKKNAGRQIYLNNGAGFDGTPSSAWTIPLDLVDDKGKDQGFFFLDLNRDNLPDLLQIREQDGTGGYQGTDRTAYLNNGSTWVSNSAWSSNINTVNHFTLKDGASGSNPEGPTLPVDLNGDGRVDLFMKKNLLWLGTQYINRGYQLNTGTGFATLLHDRYLVCDTATPTCLRDSAVVQDQFDLLGNGVNLVAHLRLGKRFFDLNGDGLTDFLTNFDSQFSGSTLNAYLNDGRDFVRDDAWAAPVVIDFEKSVSGVPITHDQGVRIADVNGDGAEDLVQARDDNGTLVLNVWVNHQTTSGGSPWVSEPAWNVPGDAVFVDKNSKDLGVRLADVNGDGLVDLLVAGQGGTKTTYLNQGTKPDLLVRIENGMGGSIQISYQAVSGDALVNGDLPHPVWTVSEVRRSDGSGSGNDIVTTFTYYQGFYDLVSREFRGFGEVTSEEADGTKTVTVFHQDDALKGQVASVKIYNAQDVEVASTTTTYLLATDPGYDDVNLYAAIGVLLALPKRVEATLKEPSGLITTAAGLAYDGFGNIVERFEEGDVSITGDERVACIDYIATDPTSTTDPNVVAWRVALPVMAFRTGGDSCAAARSNTALMLSRTTYAYHSQPSESAIDGFWTSRKEVLRDTIHSGNAAPGRDVETTREPDEYGNVRSVTTSPNQNAVSPQTVIFRTTTIAYDGEDACLDNVTSSTHTFPCAVIPPDPFGNLPTFFTFDAGFEKVKDRTDANGHKTLYSYDALGQLTLVSFKAGGSPSFVTLRQVDYPTVGGGTVGGTWGVLSGTDAQNIHTIDYATAGVTTPESGLETQNYFDGLGRTWTRRTDGDDYAGAKRKVDIITHFDNRGRVKETSLPFFAATGAEPAGWSALSYDALGRLTQVQHPNGSCTKMVHDVGAVASQTRGITTVERRGTCAGQAVQKRASAQDAFGNVIEVREYEPVSASSPFRTTYEYDKLDNLSKVYDACSNDSGLCSGRPAGQMHVTEIIHDTLSRKVRAIDPAMGTWTYKYDDAGNLEYQKDNKPDTFANEITFTYDEVNRLKLKNYESASSIVFTYDQGTNGLGRLTKVTDQAGSVSYAYDPRGNLSSLIRDFQPVNERFEFLYHYDNLGRLTKTEYPRDNTTQASVARTEYKYNAGSLQTPYVQSIKTVSGTTTRNVVQESLTEYDAASNLNKFTDGSGVQTTLDVDPLTSQLTGKVAQGAAGNWLNQDYTYDATTGNLKEILNPGNPLADQTYTAYDALGRLLKASGPWKPNSYAVEAAYTYDAIGNLLTKDQIASYPDGSKALAYAHATNPHAVTQLTYGNGPVKTYSYDANGNQLMRVSAAGTQVFGWDQDNRLLSITQNGDVVRTFKYDYTGERVYAEVTGQPPKLYIPTRDFEWDGVSNANLYVFLGNLRVASVGVSIVPPNVPVGGWVRVDWEKLGGMAGEAAEGLWPLVLMLLGLGLTRWWTHPRRAPIPVLVRRAGVGVLVVCVLHATSQPALALGPPFAGHINVVIYYQSDYKGSTGVVVNETQQGLQGLDYWPYGAVRGNLNNGTINVRHKFTDQEIDDYNPGLVDLYYYGGRWYDPETGRFLSPDPFVPSPLNPQSLNRYSYVVNDPTNLIDPSGYFWGALIGWLAGFLLDVGRFAAGAIRGVGDTLGLGSAFKAVGLSGDTTAFAAGRNLLPALGRVATDALEVSAGFGEGFAEGAARHSVNRPLPQTQRSPFEIQSRSPYSRGRYGGKATFNAFSILSNGPTSLIGLGLSGAIGADFAGYDFETNSFLFNRPPGTLGENDITLGNVVLCRGGFACTNLPHELGHVPQGTFLSVGYLPAHVASYAIAFPGALIETTVRSWFDIPYGGSTNFRELLNTLTHDRSLLEGPLNPGP